MASRIVPLCIFTGLLASLPGCASFYVHNPAIQKSTESARAALDSIKLDAIFDDEAHYLDDLQAAEADAVTAHLVAERDHELLLFLNGMGPGGLDGLTTLRERIDAYLESLAGASDSTCNVKLWRALPMDSSTSATIEDLQAFRSRIVQMVTTDLRSPTCTSRQYQPPPSPLLSPSPSKSLDGAIGAVLADLQREQALRTAADVANADLAARLMQTEDQWAAGTLRPGAVRRAMPELAAALTHVNPYIRRYASGVIGAKVAATIDALGPPSQAVDIPLTKQARSGVAVMQALYGVGDAFSAPPRVPHPNALAAAQSWLAYLGSSADNAILGQRTLLKDHEAQLAAIVTAVYYLSRAGEAAVAIKSLHRKALSSQQGVTDLMDSPDGDNTRAIDGALVYYADAWTRGFAADAVAGTRGQIDTRRIKLVRTRAAGAAWLGTLKPAVDTLANYGTGGLDPGVVAQLFQALGIGGIAVGVNR